MITCRVLYTASSKYGLQIISDKNVENITLSLEGMTFEEGRENYNNAIETLNNAAEKYINPEYATDARCVGSMPTVENGVFVDKNSETAGPTTLQFTYKGSTSIDCKGTDNNYMADQMQMQNLDIWARGEEYWLASRIVDSSSSRCTFSIRTVNLAGNLSSGFLCNVNSSGSYPNELKINGLRPCFLLKNDITITTGDGKTEDTAYIIGR